MSDEILIRRVSTGEPTLQDPSPPPDDTPLILNSWLESHRGSSSVAGVPNDIYFRFHHRIATRLLVESDEQGGLWIACSADRPGQVVGWICATQTAGANVLHYVYVKQKLRKHGIARALVRKVLDRFPTGVPTMFTHKTPIFWKKEKVNGRTFFETVRKHGLIYHPYLLPASNGPTR